jgi:cytochrome c peroxidase
MTNHRLHSAVTTSWAVGLAAAAAALTAVLAPAGRTVAEPAPSQLTFVDASGIQSTVTTAATFDTANPFFQPLGTNGRSCATCHRPRQAWSLAPNEIRVRFEDSDGLDPLFTANDGSNCEGADVSTVSKRRRAFSLLLSKGLVRIGLPVPDGAEFDVAEVDDPYDCGAPLSRPSMYRRPLPTTNLKFLSAVMWDGRQTLKGQSIAGDLARQASDAVTGHEQGAVPSDAQLAQIVGFETALFTAQTFDTLAGSLSARGATGGPAALSSQAFCIGVNDPLRILPAVPGACAAASTGLDPVVFTLFDAWADAVLPGRRAIARGEAIFNTRQFVISGVPGLNGAPQDPLPGPAVGTCTLCHNTPNAGDHSIAMPLDLGVASASRRTLDLPLYTLRNRTTGETVQTSDPGRAMVTGKWADVGKFKGPILRALAARAPYFHNGFAATLGEVVDFYNTRFQIGLTDAEKADLVAFLRSL